MLRTAVFISEGTATPIFLPPVAPTVGLVLQDFVAAMQGKKPVPITLDDGLKAVALVEAAYIAARTGQYVPVAAPETLHA